LGESSFMFSSALLYKSVKSYGLQVGFQTFPNGNVWHQPPAKSPPTPFVGAKKDNAIDPKPKNQNSLDRAGGRPLSTRTPRFVRERAHATHARPRWEGEREASPKLLAEAAYLAGPRVSSLVGKLWFSIPLEW